MSALFSFLSLFAALGILVLIVTYFETWLWKRNLRKELKKELKEWHEHE